MTEENIAKVLELFIDTGLLDELNEVESETEYDFWTVKLKAVLDKLGPKNRKRLHDPNHKWEQIRLWSKAIRRYLLDKDAEELERRRALFAQSILRREQEELRNQQAS